MFYCREEELRTMNQRYEKGRFECIVIYGRRRVGKTALINEFCKGKPTVCFSALNASSQKNLDAISAMAKAEKSISSRLQHIIDHQWQNSQI